MNQPFIFLMLIFFLITFPSILLSFQSLMKSCFIKSFLFFFIIFTFYLIIGMMIFIKPLFIYFINKFTLDIQTRLCLWFKNQVSCCLKSGLKANQAIKIDTSVVDSLPLYFLTIYILCNVLVKNNVSVAHPKRITKLLKQIQLNFIINLTYDIYLFNSEFSCDNQFIRKTQMKKVQTHNLQNYSTKSIIYNKRIPLQQFYELQVQSIARLMVRNKQQLKQQLLSNPFDNQPIKVKDQEISVNILNQFMKRPQAQIISYQENECQNKQKISIVNNFLYTKNKSKSSEKTKSISPMVNKYQPQPEIIESSKSLIDVSKNLSKIQFQEIQQFQHNKQKSISIQNDFQLLKQLDKSVNNYQNYEIKNQKLLRLLSQQSDGRSKPQRNIIDKIMQNPKTYQKLQKEITLKNIQKQKGQQNQQKIEKEWSLPSYHSSSEYLPIEEKIKSQTIEEKIIKEKLNQSSNSAGQSNKLHQMIMKTQQQIPKRQKIKISKSSSYKQQIKPIVSLRKNQTQKEPQNDNGKAVVKTIKIDLSKYSEGSSSINQSNELAKPQPQNIKKELSFVRFSSFPQFQMSLNAISLSKFSSFNQKEQLSVEEQIILSDQFDNYQSSSSNINQLNPKKLQSVLQEDQSKDQSKYQENDQSKDYQQKNQSKEQQKDQQNDDQLKVLIPRLSKQQIKRQKQILQKQFLEHDLSSINHVSDRKHTDNDIQDLVFKKTQKDKQQQKALKLFITEDLRNQINSLKEKIKSDLNVSSQIVSQEGQKSKKQQMQIPSKQNSNKDSNIMNVFEELNERVSFQEFRNGIENLKLKMMNESGN